MPRKVIQTVPYAEDTRHGNIEIYPPHGSQIGPGPTEYPTMEAIGNIYPSTHGVQPMGHSR